MIPKSNTTKNLQKFLQENEFNNKTSKNIKGSQWLPPYSFHFNIIHYLSLQVMAYQVVVSAVLHFLQFLEGSQSY